MSKIRMWFSVCFASLVMPFLLVSCGESKEPLSKEEMKEIGDKILNAIVQGKLPCYEDDTGLLQQDPEKIKQQANSIDMQLPSITSYTMVTKQEIALTLGDFSDTSTEIGLIMPMTKIDAGQFERSVVLTYLKPNEVKKALGSNLGSRFIYHFKRHFNKHRADYNYTVAKKQQAQIIKNIFKLLKDGSVAAYETESMGRVLSPNELAVHHEKKEFIQIPDRKFPNEFIDSMITSPVKAEDITDLRGFYNDKSELVGITLMSETKLFDVTAQAYRVLPSMPWIFISTEDLKAKLSEKEIEIIKTVLKRTEDNGTDEDEYESPSIDTNANDTSQV